jgi:ABC-type bacteriocin/lantibiotic exporter with double-glycine peptidase domain
MKKNTLLVLWVFLMFSSTSALAGVSPKPVYSIQLSPQAQSDTYILKLGQSFTFTIQAFKQNPATKEQYSTPVSHIWWQYNLSMLEKVKQDKNSLTLRPIEVGKTKLNITVSIKNYSFTKSITIVIEK